MTPTPPPNPPKICEIPYIRYVNIGPNTLIWQFLRFNYQEIDNQP